VSFFDGRTWQAYTRDDGLASDWVEAIAVDGSGTLWFGTDGSGVIRFDGRTWRTYAAGDGLGGNYVRSIAVDNNGALWFGTNGGVSRFEQNK